MDKKPKRMVPEVRFKGFTDDWEQRKLGEIANTFSGGTPSVSNKSYYNGDIPFIRSAEINKEKTELFLTQEGIANSSAKLVRKGTLLYALYGATSGEVGIAKINGAINQAIMAIEPKKDNSYFIESWLIKNKEHIITTYLQGGQGNLSAKIIKSLSLGLPKIKEQFKVRDLITIVDYLISLQQRKLEQLKQLKKVMLQRLFVQNKEKLVPIIRFNNFNIQWRLNTLNGLQENVYSGLSGKTKIDFGHGDARYITYLNVHDNIIAKVSGIDKIEKDLNQNKVEKGDILFTISSEVPEEVALNSVWPSNYGKDLYLNSFCFGYRPIPGKVNPFFLSYYLRTPFLRKNVFPLAQGISRFNISKKNILNISIAIPSLEEQNSIYKLLAELDKILDQKKMNINQFKAIKKFLLQKLFI